MCVYILKETKALFVPKTVPQETIDQGDSSAATRTNLCFIFPVNVQFPTTFQ